MADLYLNWLDGPRVRLLLDRGITVGLLGRIYRLEVQDLNHSFIFLGQAFELFHPHAELFALLVPGFACLDDVFAGVIDPDGSFLSVLLVPEDKPYGLCPDWPDIGDLDKDVGVVSLTF